eukprot:6035644-Ditylum_brightwellii.AAC.1
MPQDVRCPKVHMTTTITLPTTQEHPFPHPHCQTSKKMQQSAVMCLYRQQKDIIVPLSLPPWQRSAVVRCWCHSDGPKTRKWHQRRRWLADVLPKQWTWVQFLWKKLPSMWFPEPVIVSVCQPDAKRGG